MTPSSRSRLRPVLVLIPPVETKGLEAYIAEARRHAQSTRGEQPTFLAPDGDPRVEDFDYVVLYVDCGVTPQMIAIAAEAKERGMLTEYRHKFKLPGEFSAEWSCTYALPDAHNHAPRDPKETL